MTQPIRQAASEALKARPRYRFPIEAELEYKLLDHGIPAKTGHGWTVNMSSAIALVELQEPVPVRRQLELRIAWPAWLNEKVRLNLWILGRTIEVRGNQVVVEILNHEFRTSPTGRTFHSGWKHT